MNIPKTPWNLVSRTVDRSFPELGGHQHDEIEMLMSLALDEQLGDADSQKLHDHLRGCASCQNRWRHWSILHQQFLAPEFVMPPPNFAHSLSLRLEQRSLRRQKLVGVGLAAFFFFSWLAAILGTGMVVGWMAFRQMNWFGEMFSASLLQLQSIMETVGRILLSFGTNPTALAASIGYLLLYAIVLFGWTRLLQRTLRPMEETASLTGAAKLGSA